MMNKNKSKGILLIVGILSIMMVMPFASAYILPSVSYQDNGDTAIIKNWYGFGGDVAHYTLDYSTDQCLIDCESGGQIHLYESLPLFDLMEFKDKTGTDKLLDYHIYYSTNESYQKQIDHLTEECSADPNSTNGTQICDQINNPTTETVYQEVWHDYNGETLPAGYYGWKITGKKNPMESIDWIGTSAGLRLDAWTWWNSSWTKKQQINFTSTGNISAFVVTYDSDMKTDFSDLRFLDSTESIELNYTISNYTASTSAMVRINNIGASSIYMYYGNAVAPSVSSANNTYLSPLDYYFFDEPSGTAVIDYARAYNGTLSGTYSRPTGVINNSVGIITNGKIAFSPSNSAITNGTINLWIKGNNLANMCIGQIDSTDNVNAGTLQGSNTQVGIFPHDTTVGDGQIRFNSTDSATILNNQWHMWTITFTSSASSTKFYLDGVLRPTTQGEGKTSNPRIEGNMLLGARRDNWGYWNGSIDEFGVYNRELTQSEISALFNSTMPTVTFGEEVANSGITSTLNSPVDVLNSSSSLITFNCSANTIGAITLVNSTLYIWNGGVTTNTTSLTGNSNSTIWTNTKADGNYTWSCLAAASDGSVAWATANRTFTIDSTAPTVSIIYPTATNYNIKVYDLNYSASDTNLASCWYSNNSGITNHSIACGTNATLSNHEGNNLWTVYANDTFGNQNSASVNFSVNAPPTIILNSPTNGSIVYNNPVTINSTGTALGTSTLTNVTLWDNSTGTWGERNNTIFISGQDQGAGIWTTGFSVTDNIWNKIGGMRFRANESIILGDVTFGSGTTYTQAWLQNSDRNVTYQNVTLIGRIATFNYNLTANTDYWIVAPPSGYHSYQATSGGTYPTISNKITFNRGLNPTNGLEDTSNGGYEILNITYNKQVFSVTQTFSNSYPVGSNITWNFQFCDSDGACGFSPSNYSFTVDSNPPIIIITSPSGDQGSQTSPYNVTLNFTASDVNLDSCWFNSTLNSTIIPTTCNVPVNISITSSGTQTIYVYANDTLGNTNSNSTTIFSIITDNGITYASPVVGGDAISIIGNFTLAMAPTSVALIYNNQSYVPTISVNGNEYILTNNLIAPPVTVVTNVPFYYSLVINGTTYNSSTRIQIVNPLKVSTNCSAGTFPLLNITNYNEETLNLMNGTVEYFFNIINNGLLITTTNGTANGSEIQLCSDQNLSASTGTINLQLRYYATGFMYETYNIQNGPLSSIPYSVNLYFLNSSIGTQFIIDYVDFNYLHHPNIILQIQRQYLAENLYRVIEMPLTDSNGKSQASFNMNNIRYKIIAIEDGVIIDTLNDIFPVCQNIILGTCQLNLRGEEIVTPTTNGDFTYFINKTNTSVTLTYIIPSGTPKLVTFSTIQNSRFLENVSFCLTSLFASGGTITCSYNATVGDSLINTQVDITGQSSLYGTVGVPEDLQQFFLLNNYVIAFFMLLGLVLMFISSAMAMLIVAGIGVIYLGFIFLIKGAGIGIISVSISWLLIAIVLAVYKIAQKEERT